MRLSPQQKAALEAIEPRMRLVLLFAVALFMAIVFRLWSLQFAERERYRALAQRNYLRTVTEPALRGRIFDRNGKPLAENVPVYDLVVNWVGIPSRSRGESIQRLAPLAGKTDQEIRNRLRAVQANHEGDQVIEEEIGFAKVVAIREARIPGVEVRVRPMRHYPYGTAASHLIGYLGEINEKELERYADRYRMGEWVGKMGLERKYEFDRSVLKGENGQRKIQVYASGLMSGEIPDGYRPSSPGRDIWTTLDIDLQLAAEEILGASEGAIVAMDPRTGDILAMVSHPTFDPNVFVRPSRVAERGEALRNQFNYALNGGHAFGSIFKIVVATAGLEEGIISPEDTFYCEGRIRVGQGWKHCHLWWKYRYGHGDVDLVASLMRSCDVYYYRLSQKMGYEPIIDYARRVYGLIDPPSQRYRVEGQEEPFSLVGEDPDPGKGLMTRLRRGSRYWYAGDTLNLSIGQGELSATPLQVNVMMSVLANGGILYQPRLVTRVTNFDGSLHEEYPVQVCSRTPLKPRTLASIKEALRKVVNSIRGTAYEARIKGLDLLGKTGTAERAAHETDAWFSCFAPGEEPELVVTVAVPESGHGGDVASPLAQQMMLKYFAERLGEQVSQAPSSREERL